MELRRTMARDNEQTAPSEILRSASFSLIVPSQFYVLRARSDTGHRSQTTWPTTLFLPSTAAYVEVKENKIKEEHKGKKKTQP